MYVPNGLAVHPAEKTDMLDWRRKLARATLLGVNRECAARGQESQDSE